MPRMTEPEREALRLAATAAVPILANLKEERADLDKRIASYEHIVAEYNAVLSGRRLRKSSSGEDQPAGPKRGQVGEHIDAILTGGSDYKEPEIRRAIWERFGIKYSRATTYTTLRRGEGKKYEQKEKRWRLIQSA